LLEALLDELDEAEVAAEDDESDDELELDSPAAGLLSVEFFAVLAAEGFEELYRSAYQPPPLSTKPVPPLTWRRAVALRHWGHFFSGASLMD